MLVKFVSESVYRVISERCCKSGRNMGQFALSCVDRRPVGGAPDESHFTTLRTGGIGVQSLPFLKSKRRFLIKGHLHWTFQSGKVILKRRLSVGKRRALNSKLDWIHSVSTERHPAV